MVEEKIQKRVEQFYAVNYSKHENVKQMYGLIKNLKDGPFRDTILAYMVHVESTIETSLDFVVRAGVQENAGTKVLLAMASKLEERIIALDEVI